MKLVFETSLGLSFLAIKSDFNLDLFKALKPPLVQMAVIRFDGCSPDDEIHIELNTLGKKQQWVSVITQELQSEREWSFVDEGKIMPWPLARWKHHHRVVATGDQASKIIDDITFDCVHSWMNILMYPILWFTFAIRPGRYRKFFSRT